MGRNALFGFVFIFCPPSLTGETSEQKTKDVQKRLLRELGLSKEQRCLRHTKYCLWEARNPCIKKKVISRETKEIFLLFICIFFLAQHWKGCFCPLAFDSGGDRTRGPTEPHGPPLGDTAYQSRQLLLFSLEVSSYIWGVCANGGLSALPNQETLFLTSLCVDLSRNFDK